MSLWNSYQITEVARNYVLRGICIHERHRRLPLFSGNVLVGKQSIALDYGRPTWMYVYICDFFTCFHNDIKVTSNSFYTVRKYRAKPVTDTYDHRDIYVANPSEQTLKLITSPWITGVE